MTEQTPNDAAFIKVSSELIRRRNDLVALQKLKTVSSRLDNWSRGQIRGTRTDTLHSDEFSNLSRILGMIESDDAIHESIERTQRKIEELTVLSEIYLRGGDVVAAKLTSSPETLRK